MSAQSNYLRWMNSPIVSEETKEILRHMSEEEKTDAFFKDAEFGTGGMRGILGPGTNRLNLFTVNRVTIAFARYIHQFFPKDGPDRGVVISHDNRNMSREFALASAHVLNEAGIRAYLFDSLRPTPELSFAVRRMNAIGGIMITASHNPKEYNGYKIYDETGCQMVFESIDRLLDILSHLPNELEVQNIPAEKRGECIILPKEIDDEYVDHVTSIALHPELDKTNFRFVFTPQHGTSYLPAMRVFEKAGYGKCVIPVEDQCTPDGNFTHTLCPNPEDPRAYMEAIEIADREHADLVVTTDPDADRVGMGYRGQDGKIHLLTGNQSGALLIDYIFSQRKAKGTLHKDGVMFNTIVTSTLGKKVSESYGVRVESLLTGFKYIGSKIHEYEVKGGATYEFGYEESYGCLISPFARDKDAQQALLLYVEMTLFYKNQGKTLDQVYEELEKKHGYYKDTQFSIYFQGESGAEKMANLMENLHQNPCKNVGEYEVVTVDDYLTGISTSKDGSKEKLPTPPADVIRLHLNNGTWIAVRPSGTEPKCKFYYCACGHSQEEVDSLPAKLHQDLLRQLHLENE